jgi:hypothetical protein
MKTSTGTDWRLRRRGHSGPCSSKRTGSGGFLWDGEPGCDAAGEQAAEVTRHDMNNGIAIMKDRHS